MRVAVTGSPTTASRRLRLSRMKISSSVAEDRAEEEDDPEDGWADAPPELLPEEEDPLPLSTTVTCTD